MPLEGTVTNGVIVLDQPQMLPEGTRVEVVLKPAVDQPKTLLEAVGGKGPGDPPTAEDLFAGARQRGQRAREELLAAEGGVLSPADVGKLLKVPAQAIEEHRKAGQLLAIDLGVNDYAYPAWQFTKTGLLPGLEEVLGDLGEVDPWAKMRFFLSGSHRLNGRTPLQELRSGSLDAVRRAARNFGEHGAA